MDDSGTFGEIGTPNDLPDSTSRPSPQPEIKPDGDDLADAQASFAIENDERVRAAAFWSAFEQFTGGVALFEPTIREFIVRISVGEAGSRPRLGQVSEGTLRELQVTYVEPDWHEEAEKKLSSSRVVLLQGSAGFGKTTTAIRLLDDACPGAVTQLSADTDLRTLPTGGTLDRRRGYLIAALPPGRLGPLRRPDLEALSSHLAQQGSFLAVTLDHPAADGLGLNSYVVECRSIPDTRTLLGRRFGWHLARRIEWQLEGGRRASYHRELETTEVKELLAEDLRPQEVDDLAQLLLQVVCGEIDRTEAVRRHSRTVERRIRDLLDGGSAWQRSLVLTLAVLNDTWYQYVVDAAVALHDQIGKTERPQAPGKRKVFAFRRVMWSEIVYHQPRGVHVPPLGPVSAEQVGFRNSRFPRAILDLIWHDYVGARRPLLEWLGTFGTHRSGAVRSRVAAAVGYLATLDFWLLWQERLHRWASSANAQEREMAALALAVPARDDMVRTAVTSLLSTWSQQAGRGRNRRRTAVAAHGGPVGRLDPERALNDLGVIARNDPGLIADVRQSVLNLFEAGETTAVVEGLLRWDGDPPSRSATNATRGIFLDLVARIEQPGGPKLLRWAAGEPHRAEALASLWSTALRPKAPEIVGGTRTAAGVWATDALRALREWIRAADDIPAFQQPVQALVTGLNLPGDRLALCQRVHAWACRGRSPGRHVVARIVTWILDAWTRSAIRAARRKRLGRIRRALVLERLRERRGLRSMLYEMALGETGSPTALALLGGLEGRRADQQVGDQH